MWPIVTKCGLSCDWDLWSVTACGFVVTFEPRGKQALCTSVCCLVTPSLYFHSDFEMEIQTGYKATVCDCCTVYTVTMQCMDQQHYYTAQYTLF